MSLRRFRRVFGAELMALHGAAVEAWRARELATLDRRRLRLVPQARRARLATLLWLVPAEDLEAEIARQR